VSLTGDEAQVFLRSGAAVLGIGKDRFAAGSAVEEKFRPDVMILDDGFQHWRLSRDLDFILVDALDPFGGGQVFPLGRLREPLEALSRANVFVITRTEQGAVMRGLSPSSANTTRLLQSFGHGSRPSAGSIARRRTPRSERLAAHARNCFLWTGKPKQLLAPRLSHLN